MNQASDQNSEAPESKPSIELGLGELKEKLEAISEREDIIHLSAKIMKKRYDALIEVGFESEDAALIVAHKGTGVTPHRML